MISALAACLFSLQSTAHGGEDIVFSGAKIAERNGAYFQTETHHLYRCRHDGSDIHPLTAGPMDNTDPKLSPDGKRILFERRDRDDLVGTGWLCSIRLDGADLKAVQQDSLPETEDDTPSKDKPSSDPPLAGIPSSEGGTCVPEHIAQLQDGEYAYGYFDVADKLGLAPQKGKQIRILSLFRHKNGSKETAEILGDDQWRQNPEGSQSFWLDSGDRRLIVQTVDRTAGGGAPHLYWIDAKSGEIVRQVDGQFLQDCDHARTTLLSIGRSWGNGFGTDDAVAREPLNIWSRSGRPTQIALEFGSCRGAVFVQTKLPTPAKPNTSPGIPPRPRRHSGHDVVFAAEFVTENLNNMVMDKPSHIYLAHSDGSGCRRLTTGSGWDSAPSLDANGSRILFWRSRKQWEGPYSLFSVSMDGSSLKPIGFTIRLRPDAGLAQAASIYKPSAILKVLAKQDLAVFSPDGKRAVVARKEEAFKIVDIATGKTVRLNSRWKNPSWIDNRTILAEDSAKSDPQGSHTLAYLNLSGRAILSKTFDGDLDEAGPFEDMSAGSAHPLERNRFLLTAWHFMSDGGYGHFAIVDMKQGTIESGASRALLSVSADHRSILATSSAWEGGYKGVGAAKLDTLYIRSLSGSTESPVGFRRMNCFGACFVPEKVMNR